jgi:transcriptional accessory protein Tex/SPT6
MVAEGAPVEEATADAVQVEQAEAAMADAVAAKEMVAEGAPVEETAQNAPATQAEASDAETEEAAQEGTEVIVDADGNKRVVRTLSVGQQVTGTVKRVADFGAFVDIGVGRDGLIHISELSVRRVGKVTDVLNEGQEVTAWIKKLDRDRNRISLTLIDPTTKTIRDLEKGELVQGTVTRILPYGAFVDIGVGRDALLHVREMGEGYVAKPEDVVKVGESIEARIIELSRRRGRVDLSLKGLRPEPEPVQATPVQQQQPQVEEEPEEEAEDTYADVEVLSPMQLAFKKAMQAEGIELDISSKKSGKRNRRERTRSIQDEIIARTLSSGKK